MPAAAATAAASSSVELAPLLPAYLNEYGEVPSNLMRTLSLDKGTESVSVGAAPPEDAFLGRLAEAECNDQVSLLLCPTHKWAFAGPRLRLLIAAASSCHPADGRE